MAIDKNSKAYQNLVKSGYTDEQITQMHSDLSSGQTAKEVVANTQPTPSSTPTTPTTTPTETPTTPTVEDTTVKQEENVVSTVPEIKQEGALKPLSEEYYQQDTQEAQDKIVANLNNYKQSNPEYFSDYDSFKKNFSYDARSDQQKNTLDQWYKGYTTGLQLSNVPTNDLYTQYKDGQLSNADMESLRIANPTKYTELQNQINKGTIIAAYDDSTAPETMNFQEIAYKMIAESLNRMGSGDYGTSQFFDDYEKKMNSPEMLELSDKTTALQEDITNIQDDIESMRKQVEAEYEGKGASRAKINAIVADRTYDLQLQLRTLNNEYTKYATDYNNRANQYQNEFNLQLQEYQLNMQARNQQMDELGFAIDLMNFETNDQKQEREWNYWVKQQEYNNGNINSSDYQTRYKAALKSVENLLAQYPNIPMQRSAEQMAEDILKGMDANGTTLGDELTKINKQIQGKPEYKYLYNNTFSPTSSSAGSLISDSITIDGQEYVKYNGERMMAEEFNKMFKGNGAGTGKAKDYTVVDESLLSNSTANLLKNSASGGDKNLAKFLIQSKNMNGSKGGQCGKFVNDYLQYIGVTGSANRYYDNDLSTKLNSVNSYTPKVGTIAVFDYGHKSSDGINHGHVGIVTKVYDDGSFDMRDSNGDLNKPETIRTIHVTPSSSLKGFFDPSKAPISSGSDSSTTVGNSVVGSIDGVPLAYERAVKNLVPTPLQNSDAEREALNKIIKNAYGGGIDQSQIALTFMGFDIKNDKDKDLALGLVNTIRTLNSDTQEGIVQTISDFVNQGNYSAAVQTVENAVTQQAKEAGNYVSELSVKTTINRANELSDYISGLDKSPIGVVEGTMQGWLKNVSSSKAKEIKNRIALVESALDIKDEDILKNIVPQLSDQPSVFMSKLQNLNNATINELNGWRTLYGLPELTTDSLKSYSNRVDLYKNGGSSNTSGAKNTTTTQSNTTTRGTGVLKKSTGTTTTTKTTVVTPNMSEFQSVKINDLGNGLMSKTVNGVTYYSYDNGKTWN